MKLKTLTLTLGLLTTGIAQAQTVDEIINKNIEAMGGAAKLTSLKSYKMSGTLSTQGMDIPIVFTRLHNKGSRVDLEINGTANYRTSTPSSGTVFMPITGMTEPTAMEESEIKSAIRSMDLQGPLYDYKSKGTTIELAGKEVVDGSEAYKLNLKYKDGESSTYYIDSKNYRLVKTVSKRTVNGQEVDIENSLSNYKQNADGYWFAYTLTNAQGPVNFEKIETNMAIEESFFK